MPSKVSDITIGSLWRPRLNGKHCKFLRKTDKAVIKSYSGGLVKIEYVSDGLQSAMGDAVLLLEYKLDTIVGVTLGPGVGTTAIPKPASYDIGKYTVGSKWITNSKEFPNAPSNVVEIISHDATCILYKYNDGTECQRAPAIFIANTTPYGEEAADPVAPIFVDSPIEDTAPVSSCSHRKTTWYHDDESCDNCGEIVKTLTMKNPYNVDPDLKEIPSYITERINRNAIIKRN